MPWWIMSMLTSFAVVGVEYLNRTQPTLGDALRWSWPLILVTQVCIYYAWNRAPALLLVWAFFGISNAMLRLAVAGYLGEPMRAGWIVAGVLLLVAGGVAIKMGTTG